MNNSVSILELRTDVHIYNTGNCEVFDIPSQRQSKSQNNNGVLGLTMYTVVHWN